jgi:hypothetical protein
MVSLLVANEGLGACLARPARDRATYRQIASLERTIMLG